MSFEKDEPSLAEAAGEAAAQGGVSLGKGAWDCDRKREIPPEKEVKSCLIILDAYSYS